MKKLLTKKNLIYVLCCLIVVAIMASFVALVAIPSVKRTAIKVAKEDLYENIYSFPEGAVITAKNGFGDNKRNSLLYIASTSDEIGANTMPLEYRVSYISDTASSNQRQYSINLHINDAANIAVVDEIINRYEMEDYCFFTGVNINQASFIRKNCRIGFYIDY